MFQQSFHVGCQSFLLYYLQIVFDDQNKDGQMVVNLFSSLNEFKCSGKFSNFCKDYNFLHSVFINRHVSILQHQFRSEFVIRIAADEDDDKVEQMLFDIFVILVSVFSSFLCIRSLYRAHNLRVVSIFLFISFLLVQLTKHIEVLLLANQGIYFATFFLAHLI